MVLFLWQGGFFAHTKVKLLSIIFYLCYDIEHNLRCSNNPCHCYLRVPFLENISYKIEDGVLTVSGTGDTRKYGQTKPWSFTKFNHQNCSFGWNNENFGFFI